MEFGRTQLISSAIAFDKDPGEAFEAYAVDNNFALTDIAPIRYWLASVGTNKNGDFWGHPELQNAASTIALKPLNINHDRDSKQRPRIIIGVNYAGEFMKNPDTGVMSVLAKAVLFTYLFREDDEVSEILSTIDRGECKASMECIFSKFAAVHPSTGEVLPHIVDEQMLIQNLRAGKAARRFLNPPGS